MKRLGLLLALALPAAAPTAARAAFTDLGSGARAPGMGNAFTAVADDAYAVYYNPAGLAQLERSQLAIAYSKLYVGLSDGSDLGVSQLTYVRPWKGGRWGTWGTAWDRFNLSDIYQEQSLYLSWGRRMWRRKSGSVLLGGVNVKYLTHSFKQLPEAFNACDQLACNKGVDPVLAGQSSKSALDADIGFLYRFPRRFQIGLLAQHVMRPDVGFAGPDRLPMNIRLGLAYKSLWMNLTGEIRSEPSPSGQNDRDIIVAGERYFPTLEHGQFGVRGSLGLGSRQWKQMTFGISYRVNKIQTDYAFILPVGNVKGTAGTHRVGLTFHFGAPTSEDQITQDLLEQAKRLREGQGPGYGYEFLEQMRPHDLSDPKLAGVRKLVEEGQFHKAHEAVKDIAKDMIADEAMIRLSNRLDLISYYYPELTDGREKWEILLSSSIHSFLYSADRKAVLQASYALSMVPENAKLNNYLSKLEEAVSIKAERLPLGHPRGFMEELLYRVEVANSRGEHEHVLALLKDISDLSPDNVTAVERAGSAYYVLGRYQEAVSAWERALSQEGNARERATLLEYINKARAKLGQGPLTSAPQPAALPAQAPEAAPAAASKAAPARTLDPRDVERLYQKGVEHYARGEYLQATAMFMRILQIDPENAPARKALARIRGKQ